MQYKCLHEVEIETVTKQIYMHQKSYMYEDRTEQYEIQQSLSKGADTCIWNGRIWLIAGFELPMIKQKRSTSKW